MRLSFLLLLGSMFASIARADACDGTTGLSNEDLLECLNAASLFIGYDFDFNIEELPGFNAEYPEIGAKFCCMMENDEVVSRYLKKSSDPAFEDGTTVDGSHRNLQVMFPPVYPTLTGAVNTLYTQVPISPFRLTGPNGIQDR